MQGWLHNKILAKDRSSTHSQTDTFTNIYTSWTLIYIFASDNIIMYKKEKVEYLKN